MCVGNLIKRESESYVFFNEFGHKAHGIHNQVVGLPVLHHPAPSVDYLSIAVFVALIRHQQP